MDYDVIVVGGGGSGFGAAVGAARNGASPLIVDKNEELGGYNILGNMSITASPVGADRLCSKLFNRLEREGFLTDLLTEYPEIMENPLTHYGMLEQEVSRAAAGGDEKSEGENKSFRDIDLHGANYERLIAFDPEVGGDAIKEIIGQYDIDLLMESELVDLSVDQTSIGELIKSGTVQTPSGTETIRGDVFVDATGVGALANMAGAPVREGRNDAGGFMPMGMQYIVENVDIDALFEYQKSDPTLDNLIKEAQSEGMLSFYWGYASEDDVPEFERAYSGHSSPEFQPLPQSDRVLHWMYLNMLKEGLNPTEKRDRENAYDIMADQIQQEFDFLTEHVPGYKNAKLSDISDMVGVRAGWHPDGEYILSHDDMINRRTFDTVVSRGKAVYGYDDFEIPFESIIARNFENLLLTGDSLSVDHQVFLAIRSFVSTILLGEVTGTSAAAAVNNDRSPKELPYSRLRDVLEVNNLI